MRRALLALVLAACGEVPAGDEDASIIAEIGRGIDLFYGVSTGNTGRAVCPKGWDLIGGGCSCHGDGASLKSTAPDHGEDWVCVCNGNGDAAVSAYVWCVEGRVEWKGSVE